MAPNDRPANENREPVAPSRRGDRVEFVVSVFVIAAIWGGAAFWLSASQWWAVGITVAVAFVCFIVAAVYRLVIHGRA